MRAHARERAIASWPNPIMRDLVAEVIAPSQEQ
jgi:hypothetical protein